MSPPKPPRPATHPDRRDDYGPKSATPPRGYPTGPELAVPHEVPDEITGTYEGEELRTWRGRRPTPERLTRLESFKDDMLERVPRIEANVQTLVDWHREEREEKRLEKQLRAQTEAGQLGLQKVRLTSRTKIIVSVIGLLGIIAGIVGTLLAKVGS